MKVREVTNTTTNNRIKIGLTLKLMLLLLEKVKEEEEITENMVKNFRLPKQGALGLTG